MRGNGFTIAWYHQRVRPSFHLSVNHALHLPIFYARLIRQNYFLPFPCFISYHIYTNQIRKRKRKKTSLTNRKYTIL